MGVCLASSQNCEITFIMRLRVSIYLKIGNLPKKATKVMNEMPSMKDATVPKVPMVLMLLHP